MTDVPRDPECMNDEADAELDDADEDENPDARYTKRRWDKYVEKHGELSESEDEDENQANGVRRQSNVPKRRRNMMDFQNSHAVPDDVVANGVSFNGSVNGINSRTASDVDPNGLAHSDESEAEALNGENEARSPSPGQREDEDDVEMADQPDEGAIAFTADRPQEATPPDSPPAMAASSANPVGDLGNDAVDEGDTLDDLDLAKEEGREEREHEDIKAEKLTEVDQRSEQ